MLHEFAIEPKALAGRNPLWQALEQFGVHFGRMISRFPRKWERLVYDACAGCKPVEKARIEVRLRSLKAKLISTGRPYEVHLDPQATNENG